MRCPPFVAPLRPAWRPGACLAVVLALVAAPVFGDDAPEAGTRDASGGGTRDASARDRVVKGGLDWLVKKQSRRGSWSANEGRYPTAMTS